MSTEYDSLKSNLESFQHQSSELQNALYKCDDSLVSAEELQAQQSLNSILNSQFQELIEQI